MGLVSKFISNYTYVAGNNTIGPQYIYTKHHIICMVRGKHEDISL